jgi:uncharacterized protein
MHPKERLQEDLKTAIKAGDSRRRDIIRAINAAIRQLEVDTRQTLSEDQVFSLFKTEIKRRRESIAEADKAGRDDISQNEQYEVDLIEAYLPKQLSREEIEIEVRKAVAEAGVSDIKGLGAVMKIVTPRLKSVADGKTINDVVKAVLGG